MQKIDLRSRNFRNYNLDCLSISLEGAKAGMMVCTLEAGESSEAHNHFEREAFLFTSGHARVVVASGETQVEAGDAVFFDRFEPHTVVNLSSSQPVTFHAIYWEDQDAPIVAKQDAIPANKHPSLLAFSTPATPNGDLHCGHLSGPYIAADTLVRAQRVLGGSAWHVTGRDDHQTYVEKKAHHDGVSPQEVADVNGNALQKSLTAFAIETDGFITPNQNGPYANFVLEGVDRLISRGLVKVKTGPASYSSDGSYLHEAYLSGNCPACGLPSDGNACEACGRTIGPIDLKNPHSYLSSGKIVQADCTQLVFCLSNFQDELSNYVKSSELSSRSLTLSLDLLERGLTDLPISHPTSWGLPISARGVDNHVLYVWFEMAFGYLWGAAQLPCATGDTAWNRAASVYNSDIQIVHCYGFDNSWYHTLLFPAVYMALGFEPPKYHVVNELLDLEGKKFSTSRGHLINGSDLHAAVGTDYARYALLRNRPEGTRSDFDANLVGDQLDSVFGVAIPTWIDAFSAQVQSTDNKVPEPGAWLGEHQRFYKRLQFLASELRHASHPSSASPRSIARIFEDLALQGAHFQSVQSHLFENAEIAGNYRRSAIAIGAVGLRLLCAGAKIVTPNLGANLANWLHLEMAPSEGFNFNFLEPNHPISKDKLQLETLNRDHLHELVANLERRTPMLKPKVFS